MSFLHPTTRLNWLQMKAKLHASDLNLFGHHLPLNLLTLAAPVMLLCVFLEYTYSEKKKLDLYSRSDLLGNLGIGIGYLIATTLVNNVTFYVVWWFYYHLTPFTIPTTWWSCILCILVYDLARYWAHRIAHEQRFWWASHVTHHSSVHYNLTVSFRMCWIDQIKIVFFLPVLMMGFDPFLFFIVHQFVILYQFWCHSELIPTMPRIIEAIFVTPNHHQVHHGQNDAYLDKNYGSMFIIWDRLFGTFVPLSEKPRYGVRQALKSTINPFYLVFHEYADLVRDIVHAPSFRDRWKAMFGRPGTYTRIEKKQAAPPHASTIDQKDVVAHVSQFNH